MKRDKKDRQRRLGLFFFPFFFFCLMQMPSVRAENWIIRSGRSLGSIELGDDIQKVERFMGRTEVRMGALYWYVDEGVEFFAPSDHIESIIIVKPSFKDVHYRGLEGIMVGSREDEVVREFGPVEKALFSKNTYILHYVQDGITFYIRDGRVCKIVLTRGNRSHALSL